jgi:hypothetical protein
MKLNLLLIASIIAISGCASNKREASVESGPITAINSQKLTSSFKRQGIKLEWDCAWGTGMFESTCVKNDIRAIEVTGYAFSNGNSEAMRELAFKAAHDIALDKLVRFIRQDLNSQRVTTTIAKSIEKAEDNIKRKIKRDEEFEVNDEDAMKDTNIAIRKNTNDTVRTITESIRTNAQGIVNGVTPVSEEIVDRQTVKVTLRWDKNNIEAIKRLRKAGL